MNNNSRIRVYIACSFDGFIAGPGDDLSWLPGAEGEALFDQERESEAVGFEEFIKDVGALLMGRRTYDMVESFGGRWPYGDLPVLVATHRPLERVASSVRSVTGAITLMVADAKKTADGKDVYIDGGDLIRQAIDASLVDEMIVTVAPIILGAGRPLFAGVTTRHNIEIVSHHNFGGGMTQFLLRPAGDRLSDK